MLSRQGGQLSLELTHQGAQAFPLTQMRLCLPAGASEQVAYRGQTISHGDTFSTKADI
jgi:hypothetical protein